MSHSHKALTKDESPVAPDSTTVDRVTFTEGEDVLLHDEDGLFIFGTIVQVLTFQEKCLIQFGDDTERWAHFRDLRKIKIQEETDISCILCKSIQSTSSNKILLCHYCRRGYHQSCHEPALPSQFANGETNWLCMRCMEKRQAREKYKIANSQPDIRGKVNNNNSSSSNTIRKRRSFPYDLANLRWDANHFTNAEQKYCYCGQLGEWFKRMLQCCGCSQWFHGECISILKQPLLYGDRFFLFLCSVCNNGNEERLMRLSEELTLADMAHIALFNLTLETTKKYHDLDMSILPFIENNWKYFHPSGELLHLTATEKRTRILAAFWQFKNRFMCGRELKKKKTMWGLRFKLPSTFPSVLAPQSRHTLQLWTKRDSIPQDTVIEKISPTPPVMKKQTEGFRKNKRAHSSLAMSGEREKPSKKRARPSDPELHRTLRVRQQRATSEESICEISSDEVKLMVLSSKKTNKRKRTNGGEENSSSVSSFSASLTTPVETSSDETSSKGTLDMFIPPPQNFDGLNNPFCNLSTQNQNLPRSSGYLFVRPLKTRLSEKDIRITKTGEVKRKRFVRKWKRSSQPDLASALFSSDTSFRFTSPQTNPYQPTPKESILSYFGIEERVSRGEKYTVHARRVLSKGHAQYLIHWDTENVT
ncbi:hypothetical protein DAPPUDRAFT_301671 [Daphnia pulex]|uniref:PHD-type domain-containing protein n=1 Tax=Daphnia pulex TaxID=6669 RepID=E9GAC6_DAPPU|nr:hypothetical protein DAPPUDRAFT_301671 [Daphnia pulex]|eukprot:EFX83722.1 hypothetical protein DAPPUDRAFT_301671 [Daphnia pulex]